MPERGGAIIRGVLYLKGIRYAELFVMCYRLKPLAKTYRRLQVVFLNVNSVIVYVSHKMLGTCRIRKILSFKCQAYTFKRVV